MDSLPRDIWLVVVGKMDMDTRIKCGFIFKLGVPEVVKTRISEAVSNRPQHFDYHNNIYDLDRLLLGCRLVWTDNVRMPRYSIQRFKGAFYVMNLDNDMCIQTYTLNVATNKWSRGAL